MLLLALPGASERLDGRHRPSPAAIFAVEASGECPRGREHSDARGPGARGSPRGQHGTEAPAHPLELAKIIIEPGPGATPANRRAKRNEGPIEYRNVPEGLEIAEASATVIQAQLRASAWALDTISFATLAARFTLDGAHEGRQTIVVERRALGVPPGVTVERVSPQKLSVYLIRRPEAPAARPEPRT